MTLSYRFMGEKPIQTLYMYNVCQIKRLSEKNSHPVFGVGVLTLKRQL